MKPFNILLAILQLHMLIMLCTSTQRLNAAGNDLPEGFSRHRLSGEIINPAMNFIGSPFLFDNWSPGVVVLYNGEHIDGQYLMYNGFTDDLLWLHPGTHQTIRLDNGLIERFSLQEPGTDRMMILEKLEIQTPGQRQGNKVYAQVLYHGGIQLLVRHRIKKTGTRFERTAEGRTLRDELEYSPDHYLVDETGLAYRLGRFNRKSFEHIFPHHREEVRQVFRGRYRSLRTDSQRVELVRELDMLIRLE